jgi:hypothetical protein
VRVSRTSDDDERRTQHMDETTELIKAARQTQLEDLEAIVELLFGTTNCHGLSSIVGKMRAKIERRTEFGDAARAYTQAKLDHLELKSQIRAKARQCESLEEVDGPGGSYITGTPCWQQQTWTAPDDSEPLAVEDRCEACQESWELVQRRREIGRTLAGLATAMYGAFKREEDTHHG